METSHDEKCHLPCFELEQTAEEQSLLLQLGTATRICNLGEKQAVNQNGTDRLTNKFGVVMRLNPNTEIMLVTQWEMTMPLADHCSHGSN